MVARDVCGAAKWKGFHKVNWKGWFLRFTLHMKPRLRLGVRNVKILPEGEAVGRRVGF